MKKSQLLRNAKVLIDTPEKWTQHSLARKADGSAVVPTALSATCFCSIGAIQRVVNDAVNEKHYNGIPYDLTERLASCLSTHVPISCHSYSVLAIVKFNDSESHAEVMAVWDAAIQQAEREEAETCQQHLKF